MAIIKNAKNIRIGLFNKHTTITARFEETAEKLTMDATKKNLTLISYKKVKSHGNR